MSHRFLLTNRNKRLLAEGLDLMSRLPDESMSACFFDPQYRQVMEKMKFGNEGARQKERAILPQMDHETIRVFLLWIENKLRDGGYVFFWVDKFILGEGLHLDLIRLTRLYLVDIITWDKGRNGMGKRSRRRSEYLLILQKAPKSIATWTDKGIPDVWTEKIEHPKSKHIHAKPMGLVERLIKCVTRKGDYILDPCAGGFFTLDSCQNTGRHFIGGDLSPKYGKEVMVKAGK